MQTNNLFYFFYLFYLFYLFLEISCLHWAAHGKAGQGSRCCWWLAGWLLGGCWLRAGCWLTGFRKQVKQAKHVKQVKQVIFLHKCCYLQWFSVPATSKIKFSIEKTMVLYDFYQKIGYSTNWSIVFYSTSLPLITYFQQKA